MHYVHGSDIAEQLVNEVNRLAGSSEWILLNEENNIKSYYLPNDDHILTTMIESVIPAPAEYAHNVINLTNPVTWTKTCTKYDTVETYDHMNTIEHLRTVSMFFGGQALETLFFRTVYVELSKKLFVQAFRSIENDQFKFEEGSIVLAFLPSAWIVDVPSHIDQSHSRLRLITQTDPTNTTGGRIPGFTNSAALLRNPAAGFLDAFVFLKDYIAEHLHQKHPDPLIKIGQSMETEWADTYCSMNEACGWTAHVKKFGLSVYSKVDLNGNNIIGVKGSYHCPQPLSEVLESFSLENWPMWEPFVDSASVIQKVDENLSLVRVRIRSPISQTLMDLCFLAVVKKMIGNLGVIMFRSASHESVPPSNSYLLPSGLSFQPSEFGGCIVSFMLQGFYSTIDPHLYAPIMGARMAMSITGHLKYVAAHYANTPKRHYKSIPAWLAAAIVPRKQDEMDYVQKLQPLCKIVLDELSANHRLSYPHTAVELGVKRKRATKLPQSITTINSDHIAEKRKGQFVRPFIFLVSTAKDSRNKYLKRVSMASSHSFFDYLGPDTLTDIVQYLSVPDVIAFLQVCKCFNFFITGNRAIWKGLFWKRYGRVYSGCQKGHGAGVVCGGMEKVWDKSSGSSSCEGHGLVSCDSFDDWRETLMGKMAEERGWRLGRLEHRELLGHEGTIKYLSTHETENSNKACLVTADKNSIKVWCTDNNACLATIQPPAPIIGIQSIATGMEVPVFVVGCTNGAINFYSWHDSECLQDNVIQDTTLDGFVCLETSTVIWAGPYVHVFDNNTGQRARTYQDQDTKIKCMLFGNNENLLYSASKGGKVVMRDVSADPALAPQLTFNPHAASSVKCMKWLKRDVSLVTASADGTAKLWDPRNMSRPTSILSGHKGDIICLDTFDKYKVVSGGRDKTVRVWSVLGEVGEELRGIDGFSGKVSSVNVFRNEIYTGSVGGLLRRWSFEL